MGEYLMSLLAMAGFATTVSLCVYLIIKMKKMQQLQGENENLQRILNETDEQAKLIVHTDMELNKAQEELDKKVTSLYALQKLSRVISTTLEENQIFKRIEASYIEDLGFEKALAFLWNEKEKKFLCYLSIGYPEDESEAIKSSLEFNTEGFITFIKNEKTLSSISASGDSTIKDRVIRTFKVISFVLSPILPKEGSKGFLFVGTQNLETPITEGDEELITVLANQLGQALENARLFEKTWRAQQELEKRVEERTHELTFALEEVKRISQRKTDFVSSVSHELRTPLTSIKGYASILLTEKLGHLPEEVRARLEKINRHSDELAQFVNDLLDISRIESGRVAMQQESQEIKKIVEEVLDLLSVQLKEKQIEASYNFPKNAEVIYVDYQQIKRVFINLINNAIKFTPQNGKIAIESHKLVKEVQIDIADTGCGIPEPAREKIFEEFYRVDNPINQQVKGTGLGLALVKNIIEAHKGKIWVKSELGVGSTLSFTLPS